MQLVEQNIIVRGSLNPAIIQPNWLTKIDLIPKGQKIEVKFNLAGGSPAQFYWEDHYSWFVDSLSLRVTAPPEQPPANLTNFISKVFTILCHTPVTATGQNFVFEGKPEEIDTVFSGKDNWKIGGKVDRGIIAKLKHEITFDEGENRKVSIYLTKTNEKSSVQINFHYEAPTTEKVVEYSKEIDNNFKFANEILMEVINQ